MYEISNEVRTQVLVQALPYIQRYRDKIVVVKHGWNISGAEAADHIISDITLLWHIGVKVVLVHGTADTAVERGLTAAIAKLGGKAIGMNGADGSLFAVNKDGEVTNVNPMVITDVIGMGYIPVISAVGSNGADSVSVSADAVAAKIAGALGAEIIISLTNVRGVLKDMNDESTLISEINVSDVPYLSRQGIITGQMTEKVEYCVDAIRRGVKRAFIVDFRVPHAILTEMFSDEGIGTMLV